ncbi:MAG: 5,10-methenyltetrahydromethanopterin hydrogenase family protein, partial [Methanothermobacter sp.]
LNQVTDLMNNVGIDHMEEKLDPGALLGTADSMNFGAAADMLPSVMEVLENRKGKGPTCNVD